MYFLRNDTTEFWFKTHWYCSLLKILNERQHLNTMSEVLSIFLDFMKYEFLISICFLLYWPGFALFCYKYNWMDCRKYEKYFKNQSQSAYKTDAFLCIPFNHQLYCRLNACYIFLFLKFSSLYCSCRNSQSLRQRN